MRIQGKETRTVRGSHTELKRDLRDVLFTILLIKINAYSQMLHFLQWCTQSGSMQRNKYLSEGKALDLLIIFLLFTATSCG